MKRKRTATSPSPSLAKKQKPHDLDTRPLSPVRVNVFELKPNSYRVQSCRLSDCWGSSDFESHNVSKYPFTLRPRSFSLPNLSNLRSIPIVAPLSKENILAMNTDPAQPFTPAQSTTSSKSRSQYSPSKSSNSNLNPARAAEKLKWANILDDDAGEEALALQPEFREGIIKIVNGERGSSMKPSSVQKFWTIKKQMACRNEATIATRLMPFLIKEERRKGEDELDLDDIAAHSDEPLCRSFELDGLDWNISAPFHSHSVPIPVSLSSQTSAELGLKNPTPDVTYGFKRSEFSSNELRLLSQSGLEVAKDIVSPFFVVEWKAWRGNLLEAKLQARRAGAAMVWGRRRTRDAVQVPKAGSDPGVATPMDLDATTAGGELLQTNLAGRAFSTNTRAQYEEISNFDLNAVAFSCVISPDIVFFYVHWAEDSPTLPSSLNSLPTSFSANTVSNTDSTLPFIFPSLPADPPLLQCPKYHTALITKHFLDAESVPKIRLCMHNILDWGLEHRRAIVKTEASALVQAEEKGRKRTEDLREMGGSERKKRKI